MASGSWLVIEELLDLGDPAFVEELRACEDGQRLAAYASRWLADRRPAARRFLLEYLQRPLNAYQHEGLVKRLFKSAEKAGDDEVMAHFLVLFDRSVRRRKRRTTRVRSASFPNQAAAVAQERLWQAEGAEHTGSSNWGRTFHVWARWPIERLATPRNTTMPRGVTVEYRNPQTGQSAVSDLMHRLRLWGGQPKSLAELPPEAREKLAKCRLFSVHTRNYLRRRAWRYFRNLAKTAATRYLPAVQGVLKLYTDDDVADGLALLDNWGLVHILFHESPALWPRGAGWTLRPGHGLSELAPAPAFPDLWQQAPVAIINVLRQARCRPVRQWAIFYLRRDPALFERADVDLLIELLSSDDPDVVSLAAGALTKRPGLDTLPARRWLELLDRAPPAALDAVCTLVQQRLKPALLTMEQLVHLACSRPTPIARLGLAWLKARAPRGADLSKLTLLVEAQAESIRIDLARWARTTLAAAAEFQTQWVLDFLDCRHDDVRAEGWAWLEEDARAQDDVALWQKLFESPYDDIRRQLIEHLEKRFSGRASTLPQQAPLDPGHVRYLWATVLLNIQRGNRTKPKVVSQIVRRLTERPDDAETLLPLLKVALRSVRGPEWRAGLSGVVQLLERQPQLGELAEKAIPELQCVE